MYDLYNIYHTQSTSSKLNSYAIYLEDSIRSHRLKAQPYKTDLFYLLFPH